MRILLGTPCIGDVAAQVLVEHPEHLHLIKANLSEKVVKEKDQRLVFGPKAQLTTDQNKDTNQHLAAEDILSSLDQWQVGLKCTVHALHCLKVLALYVLQLKLTLNTVGVLL